MISIKVSLVQNQFFSNFLTIFNKNETKVNAILSDDLHQKFNFSKQDSLNWEKHIIYCSYFVDKHTNS
jgi:hypothetical protein